MNFENEDTKNEFEAQTDADGTPVLRRFVVHQPLSAEKLAVIEAYTQHEARERFEGLRPFLRASLLAVVDDFFAVSPAPLDLDTDSLPMFKSLFFDVQVCRKRIFH